MHRSGDYRFEYWKRFLAPFCPYFFRSFTRESRVRKPSFFKASRKVGFKSMRALAIACRKAPACPVVPPPLTVASTLHLPIMPVTSTGDKISVRSVGRGKYSSNGLVFTVMSPAPAETHALAIAYFRLPVA